MNEKQIVETLESEWEPEDGFFWKIRQGAFSEEEFQRAFTKISTIPEFEEAVIDRRLVSLLWYIPLFMQWQSERISESGGDLEAYSRSVTAMTNEVERLLGSP